jgi:cholesterol 24(S)-hydroxylase
MAFHFISSIVALILAAGFGWVLCFTAYLHYLHKINDHLPGPPRSCFILGHLPEIRKFAATTGGTLSEYLFEKRMKYGPLFVIFILHKPMVFLGDANYLRHVFANNHRNLYKSPFIYHKIGFIFGERGSGYGLISNTDEASWRTRRRLMNPAFHRKCLRDFMSKYNEVSDKFLVRVDTFVDTGKPITMVEEFGKVTLEAISRVSFNINTHAIEHANSPFPEAIRHYLGGVQRNFHFSLGPTFLKIFQFKLFQNATTKKQIDAARFIRKFALDSITTRMKKIADGEPVPNDLLSLLIQDGSLSVDEIVDEFVTIFVAGQDTTANTLSFALYGIITNPHVEKKLIDEINEILGDRDYIEFDDLPKLKYLSQVLDETLRKYTVVQAPTRILAKEITVGGYRIPKGNGINTVQLFFSMNPDIWKHPELFDPERFSNAEYMSDFSMTHFPFSIGPRNCIGQTFAKFEMKIILAKLLRKFKFRLLPGQTDRIKARVTNTPRDGVVCYVTDVTGL